MEKVHLKENVSELLDYKTMLERIDSTQNHLLLGNGFNCSLAVYTTYPNIFNRMIELCPDYKLLKQEFENLNCDIELLIGKVQSSFSQDNNYSSFLNTFIPNKIKSDFMKATISIVNENIKNIYQKNKEGIYLLFSQFKNYFTLNYDPFLYLLLMKYKKKDHFAMAFQNSLNFFDKQLSTKDSELYKLIDNAYQVGKLSIETQSERINQDLNRTSITDFRNQAVKIVRKKFPKTNIMQINHTCRLYINNLRQDLSKLPINDGFIFELFEERKKHSSQNVFFIHGAFHIYEKEGKTRKLAKTSEKALYQHIEDVLEAEDRNIICILKSDDKLSDIEQNNYLCNSLNKLSEIEGSVVIFGSAISENDNHIFSQLNNNPKITKIYISTCPKELENMVIKAKKQFPDKEIEYFNYLTVSYK